MSKGKSPNRDFQRNVESRLQGERRVWNRLKLSCRCRGDQQGSSEAIAVVLLVSPPRTAPDRSVSALALVIEGMCQLMGDSESPPPARQIRARLRLDRTPTVNRGRIDADEEFVPPGMGPQVRFETLMDEVVVLDPTSERSSDRLEVAWAVRGGSQGARESLWV